MPKGEFPSGIAETCTLQQHESDQSDFCGFLEAQLRL